MENSLLPHEFKSLWTGTTKRTEYPPLEKNIQVDVAIIGGGMAGITAAYYLTEAGLKVAVIEASHILGGTSGNTTAKVTSQHDLKYAFLIKNFSQEKAQLYADANQWAIEELDRIRTQEKIDCDFQRMPAYVYATTDDGAKQVREEVEAALSLGLPASFVTAEPAIPFPITGAIRFENQAIFHPIKFLSALAEKIVAKGGYIFEKTQAEDVEEEGDQSCVVKTDRGKVQAAYVIVATNFPIYDKGMFFARMEQMRSYALAAKLHKPVPDGTYIGLDDVGLSFRPHRSGGEEWIVIGGEDHTPGEDGKMEDHFHKLEQYARERFDITSIDYKWAAQDSTSIDKVAHIGRMPFTKRVFVTTGFGEWGVMIMFLGE